MKAIYKIQNKSGKVHMTRNPEGDFGSCFANGENIGRMDTVDEITCKRCFNKVVKYLAKEK